MNTLFWGIVIVLIGLLIIIKYAFNIDYPIHKIFIGFIVIMLGIKIMIGRGDKGSHGKKSDVIFGERNYDHFNKKTKEYNVVFGKGNYDFSTMTMDELPAHLKISTVFGGSEIFLSKHIPVRIKIDAAFAGAKLPDNSSAVFGTTYFESNNFKEDEPHLYIEADAVFSGLEIKYR